ncbi:MAG: SCO1664 family protein [Dehalococcoidia bacterium]
MAAGDSTGLGDIARQPKGNWSPDDPRVLAVLERAAVEKIDLLPSGSNYVFAMRLHDEEAGPGVAIYKPRRGEAPLHDFPDGTLYRRERAAYLVSEALGWRLIPPTVVRDGPHGIGAAQLYIEHRPRASYFTMKGTRDADLRRMAVFDAVVNNADRKGGHCLEAHDGRIWGIDHGLTFHAQTKLRTVIWDYAGEPIEPALLADVERLLTALGAGERGLDALTDLLHPRELQALCSRIESLLEERTYPLPPPWRPVPWPPI